MTAAPMFSFKYQQEGKLNYSQKVELFPSIVTERQNYHASVSDRVRICIVSAVSRTHPVCFMHVYNEYAGAQDQPVLY